MQGSVDSLGKYTTKLWKKNCTIKLIYNALPTMRNTFVW